MSRTQQPIQIHPSRPAPEKHELDGLEELLSAEECVRYYPPNLGPVTEPADVLRSPEGQARRDIDIFVDVPYCKTICGFCPFNVYPYERSEVHAYLDALEREIRAVTSLHDLGTIRVRTVWIGGGTPSILEADVLERMLSIIAAAFDVHEADEVTLEIKPSLRTLTSDKIDLVRSFGVGRISMGVQSTDPQQLRILGRGHTAEEALSVIEFIRAEGFPVNIDMMCRLPGQELSGVERDLEQVRTLGIDHMSWFPYVSHAGTSLADRIQRQRVPQPASRKAYFEMFDLVSRLTTESGYEQYTPYHFGHGARCLYHEDRWRMPQRETLGLGAGAFSFFNGWIYANEHNPARYGAVTMSRVPPIMQAKKLSQTERITRLAVLGIKFFAIDLAEFEQHSGVAFGEYYATELDLLQQAGLVEITNEAIICTPLGRAFNNDIATVLSTDVARRTKHPQAVDLMRVS
jgi:oxygen-independent coproporphyrinogen-3 oxidase